MKVKVTATPQQLTDFHIPQEFQGHTGEVIERQDYGNEYGTCVKLSDGDGWWFQESMVAPVGKKRGAKKGGTRRQFDVEFKKSIVRSARNLRKAKVHGAISNLLERNNITSTQLSYWERQFDQGHFDPDRAVAFSRKQEMIHG